MKRKQERCVGEETVKRIASPISLVPDRYLVQAQQLATVQLLTPASAARSLIGASSGVSAVGALTVPTAVAVAVQAEHGSVGSDQCLLGGTITYTQPTSHTSACNIVLASPPPFVQTSVSITDHTAVPSSNSRPNSIGVSNIIPVGSSLISGDSNIIYTNSSTDNTLHSYRSNILSNRSTCPAFSSTTSDNTNSSFSSTTSDNTNSSFSTSCNSNNPAHTPTVSVPLPTIPNPYAVKRDQESLTERHKRLSERFDALIRGQILELVRARGLKKTVCPSEVARALSPKAWRDLMPAVRKIGTQLVKEGLILVTQRGTIVDLSTAQGPVRFGLAE